MLKADRIAIIRNLETLGRYIEKDIERADENVEHWRDRVKEYGEDAIVSGVSRQVTYGEELNISIENMKYYVEKLEENNRLIEMLERDE